MVEPLFCNIRHKVVIYRYISHLYNTNCYLVEDIENKELIIIDAVSFSTEMLYFLEKFKGYKIIVAITHEHFDHHISLRLLSQMFDINILIVNKEYIESINDCRKNISLYSGFELEESIKKQLIIEEHHLLKIIETPGHSKFSYCYQLDDVCFSGDTIIEKEYLVLKLPGANKKDFEKSVKKITEILTQDTIILPGHGAYFLFKNWDVCRV